MLKLRNMTPQERREYVVESVSELVETMQGGWPDLEDEFDADLSLDAIDVMEIVMDLEDHFNIDIDADTADGIVTVDDMVEAVLEQID